MNEVSYPVAGALLNSLSVANFSKQENECHSGPLDFEKFRKIKGKLQKMRLLVDYICVTK